jgi:hypothetical protein
LYDKSFSETMAAYALIANLIYIEILKHKDFEAFYYNEPIEAKAYVKQKILDLFETEYDKTEKMYLVVSNIDYDHIVINNLIYQGYEWVYLSSFYEAFYSNSIDGKTLINHVEFIASVEERLAFFMFGLAVEDYDTPEEINKLSNRKKRDLIIESIVFYNNLAIEYTYEPYPNKAVAELDLLFRYFPKPSDEQFLDIVWQKYKDD